MDRRIIGICGYKQVGKDTAGDALERIGFRRYALAEPLKVAVGTVFGWTPERVNDKERVDDYWGFSPRHALQVVGTELFRHRLSELIPGIGNVWIRRMEHCILSTDSDVVVTDVRFPDEAEAVRELGGYIIRVYRPGFGPGEHPSEHMVDKIAPDFVVQNNGPIERLHRRALACLEEL